MIVMDTEELLRAITKDAPCGEDLEYDAAFLEVERSAQPAVRDRLIGPNDAVDEPDWRAVAQQARALLARTKDLRIMLLSIKAALRVGGVVGLASAVGGLRALLEQYWDWVHPRLVNDDPDSALQRINILRELCDREAVLAPIRSLPLVSLPALGNFSLRDIAAAAGEPSAASRLSGAPPDPASIDAAFGNCDLQQLRATLESLRELCRDVEAIALFVNARTRAEHALNLEPLAELLAQMLSAVTARSSRRLAVTAAAQIPSRDVPGSVSSHADGRHAAVPMLGVTGGIGSREDVVQLLDRLCEYYRSHEPSSPVPLLLLRAKRLVFMNFVDIVRELAPAGMSEVETLRGRQDADAGAGS